MASKIPIFTATRGLAAQAAARRVAIASPAVQVTKGQNGVMMAAVESDAPLVTLGLGVRSGSRNETAENRGVAHALKIAAGLSTSNVTVLGQRQALAEMGTRMNVDANREVIFYSVQVQRELAMDALHMLVRAATGQVFKPWELNDQVAKLPSIKEYYYGKETAPSRLRHDLGLVSNEDKAKDLLFKAAFRTGLGNTFYAPEWSLGTHDSAMLQSFYNKTFTNERAILVGAGIDTAALSSVVEEIKFESGAGPSDKATYFGGEVRQEGAGATATVAVGAEVAGILNTKEAVAAYVLRSAVAGGPNTKWGGDNSQVGQALGGARFTSFSESFADSGLFGLAFTTEAANAGKMTEAAVGALRNIKVTPELVEAGKKALTLEASGFLSCGRAKAFDMAHMGLILNGKVYGEEDVINAINEVTVGDVQAAAKKVSGGKLSIASFGAISEVPYHESL